jgi:hypothetical protein
MATRQIGETKDFFSLSFGASTKFYTCANGDTTFFFKTSFG